MSVKRLLDCTPSELARYTKAELLGLLKKLREKK